MQSWARPLALRHKWLVAGVVTQAAKRPRGAPGTPQGVIASLLENMLLYYVLNQ